MNIKDYRERFRTCENETEGLVSEILLELKKIDEKRLLALAQYSSERETREKLEESNKWFAKEHKRLVGTNEILWYSLTFTVTLLVAISVHKFIF